MNGGMTEWNEGGGNGMEWKEWNEIFILTEPD